MIEQNKSMIKILYVITSAGIGGAEKLLLSYLKLLDPCKYKLYVCCLREKPDDLLLEISKHVQVFNIREKNKFNPSIIIELLELYKKLKPDIIHTHLFQARVYATIAYLFYNQKKTILITHKHNNVNLRKHKIFVLFEMLSILVNRKVIAISQSVKDSLIKYEFVPNKKIYLLPNSIDYLEFREATGCRKNSNDKQIIIGTVGRLEKQKGIKYLLMAMIKILLRYPDARLEIVGDGSLINKLKNLSIKLGISNSVTFFGKFTDVKLFYSRMDVFVLPSIYEGFGIVLLEAMAAGVPVVATNVDGIKEVVINKTNGLLVPPKNPEAIAEAVIRLIEDPELTQRLVGKAFERAKLFDIQNHIMKLEQLYANLLGAESSP